MKIKLNKLVLFALGLFLFTFSFSSASPVSVDEALGAVHLSVLAEKELIKKFRHDSTWLSQIPNKSKWVNNDVIKLNEIGADPNVLINNNTYPIPTSNRVDDGIVISLYKYDTENTQVTDDELYALPYDKIGSVQKQHRETLEERTSEHGLHSLAPLTGSAESPVIETTGADDGTGRKRLTTTDIISLKRKYDDLKIPKKGRMLVLCSEHVEDLLLEDKDRFKMNTNDKTGAMMLNFYGFMIYDDVYNVVYDATNTKKAFDAASAPADRNASIAIYTPRAGKAMGSVKEYRRDAKTDPENRESVIGFRLYNIVIPIKTTGFGAIISVPVV